MDCFSNVEMVIEQNGGRAVYGWAIWQVPGVYIEAEFHCIWENDAGEMLDITPYPYRTENILFLPDSTRIYRGQQVDNIRQMVNSEQRLSEQFENLAKLGTYDSGQVASYLASSSFLRHFSGTSASRA